MKYLIVSDIHGALSGAQAMEAAFQFHKADWILIPGDILYHGPRNPVPSDYDPKAVIEIMNRYRNKIIAVRGNCDGEVDQMVLQFPCLSTSNTIPFGSHRLIMSHGHVYGRDNLPEMEAGDIFLSGHTHIPTTDENEGIFLLNPGSISLPKGGHPATYGILDEHGFTVYTLDHKPYMEVHF